MTGTEGNAGKYADDKSVKGATGLLGFTGGETSLTVGEVNGEAVAILKNPRQMNLGGPAGLPGPGGGNTTIFQISITGNTISNEMDLNRITRQLTDAVEERLGQKANLLGVSTI